MLLIPPRVAIGLVLIWGSRSAAKSGPGDTAAPSCPLLSSPKVLTSGTDSQAPLCFTPYFFTTVLLSLIVKFVGERVLDFILNHLALPHYYVQSAIDCFSSRTDLNLLLTLKPSLHLSACSCFPSLAALEASVMATCCSQWLSPGLTTPCLFLLLFCV